MRREGSATDPAAAPTATRGHVDRVLESWLRQLEKTGNALVCNGGGPRLLRMCRAWLEGARRGRLDLDSARHPAQALWGAAASLREMTARLLPEGDGAREARRQLVALAEALGNEARRPNQPLTTVFARAAASIQRARTPAGVCRAAAGAALEMCQADSAVWWRYAGRGRLDEVARRPAKRGHARRVASLPRGLLDAKGDHRPQPAIELARSRPEAAGFLDQVGATHGLLIPAYQGARLTGALSVHDGHFDQPCRDLLVALTQQAAAVLHALELTQQVRQIGPPSGAALHRIGGALTSALSLQELLGAACEQAAQATGADAALLLLADGSAPLRLRAQAGQALEETVLVDAIRFGELARADPSGEGLWRSRGRRGAPEWLAMDRSGIRTALGLTLSIRGEPLGVLVVLSQRADAFSHNQRRLLRTFAAQAAVVIENLQLFENTQRRLLEMADLTWVSARISASHDVGHIAAIAADAAAKAVDAAEVALFLGEPNGSGYRLLPGSAHAGGDGRADRLPAEGHIGAVALATGSPQTVPDARAEEWRQDAIVKWVGARALVVAPMIAQQGLRGLFVVGFHEPLTPETHLVALLSSYANQTALGLQSALLYQDVLRHLSQLSRLFEVSRTLASSLDLDQTLQTVLQSASELLDAPVCSVMLLNQESGYLVTKAACGLWSDAVLQEPIRLGEGLAGRAVQSGVALTSSDVSRDGRFRFREYAREAGLRTGIAAPLIARGRALGVINLYRRCPQEFSQDDERLLVSLANSAAVAIENAHLYQEAQARAQFLTAMMGEIGHRIRNLLQTIAGLLQLELHRPGGASAEVAIKRGIARLQSAAVVHELMRAQELQLVDMKQVARRVFEIVCQSLPEECPVEIQVSGARVMLPSQKATNVALFLSELVDNALRHGLAEAEQGRIWVSLAEGGGDVVVQVRDNGPGLPADVHPGAGPGLGLKIVQGLVEVDLGGSLQLENRGGLVVRARFPRH